MGCGGSPRPGEADTQPSIAAPIVTTSRSASNPRNRRTTDTAMRWARLASAVQRSTPSANSYRPSSWTSVKSGPQATISRSASSPETKRPPDGRPGDRDDRRIVALPWRTQPHRDDRRRREVDLVDAGRDPRRHLVAPGRRDEHAEPRIDVGAEPGERPPRTGGSDARSRERTPQPTVDSHVTIVHPTRGRQQGPTSQARRRRDLRPCSTPLSRPYRRSHGLRRPHRVGLDLVPRRDRRARDRAPVPDPRQRRRRHVGGRRGAHRARRRARRARDHPRPADGDTWPHPGPRHQRRRPAPTT